MVYLTPLQYALSVVSGVLVGFSLGLIGGGGSILAVPLFLYLVGLDTMPNYQHIAIGTTALAVGLNAYINSYMHLRRHNVSPRVGGIFAGVGVIGTLIGAYLGHITPGTDLLIYFSIAMIVLGIYVAVKRESAKAGTNNEVQRVVNALTKCPRLTPGTILKVAGAGFAVGLISGYFGIGGGFLIVPSLMFSAGLCITRAIGTSLISVGTFGIAGGAEYWFYGEVIPLVAVLYVIGGIAGGYAGTSIAVKAPKDTLRVAYGVIIVAVGIYMLYRLGII
jgi:uncharacterized membrane protein YfcA